MAGIVELDELLSLYGHNGSKSSDTRYMELAMIQEMVDIKIKYDDHILVFMFSPESRIFEVSKHTVFDNTPRIFDCYYPVGKATLTANDFVKFVTRVLINIDNGFEEDTNE
jgi:hypothetical protein